jgi:hypothetical protein
LLVEESGVKGVGIEDVVCEVFEGASGGGSGGDGVGVCGIRGEVARWREGRSEPGGPHAFDEEMEAVLPESGWDVVLDRERVERGGESRIERLAEKVVMGMGESDTRRE